MIRLLGWKERRRDEGEKWEVTVIPPIPKPKPIVAAAAIDAISSSSPVVGLGIRCFCRSSLGLNFLYR